MRFQFENLGLLDKADLEISDLTIICGENNTGKTYATYGVYGFLKNWRSNLHQIIKKDKAVSKIFQHKSAFQVDLTAIFFGNINKYLQELSKKYIEDLPQAFASSPHLFTNTKVAVEVSENKNYIDFDFERIHRPSNDILISFKKPSGSEILDVFFTANPLLDDIIQDLVVDAIVTIVFSHYFPNTHIASVERTGAALFRSELDSARSNFIRTLRYNNENKISSKFILKDLFKRSKYSWPVDDNVDFARSMDSLDKSIGALCEENPEILEAFSKIIGGTYKVLNEQIVFQSNEGKDASFTMNQASSSARALVDIGFYLRSKAAPGDLLIIDEPELSLHPKSQRAFARLLALLVNSGVKIFITTHSDYIIKEINTLILLSKKTEFTENVRLQYHYSENELIEPNRAKMYFTERSVQDDKKIISVENSPIDPNYGIEVKSFDREIVLMNEIQEQLLFGE